jgi:hypothetical protein
MFASDVLGMESSIAILIVLISVMLLFYALSRVRAGHRPPMRPLPAFDMLSGMSGRAAESGQTLHVGLGTGGISASGPRGFASGLCATR